MKNVSRNDAFRLAVLAAVLLCSGSFATAAFSPCAISDEFRTQYLESVAAKDDGGSDKAFTYWEERLHEALLAPEAHDCKGYETRVADDLIRLYTINDLPAKCISLIRGIEVQSQSGRLVQTYLAVRAVSGFADRENMTQGVLEDLLALRSQAIAMLAEEGPWGAVEFRKEVWNAFGAARVNGDFLRAAFYFRKGLYNAAADAFTRYAAYLDKTEISDETRAELRRIHMDEYSTHFALGGVYLTIADKFAQTTDDIVFRSSRYEQAEGEAAQERAQNRAKEAYEAADKHLGEAIKIGPGRCTLQWRWVNRVCVNQSSDMEPYSERLNIARRLGLPADEYLTAAEALFKQYLERFQGSELKIVLCYLNDELNYATAYYNSRDQLPPKTGYAMLRLLMNCVCTYSPSTCLEDSSYQFAMLKSLQYALSNNDQSSADAFLAEADSLEFDAESGALKKYQDLQEEYLKGFVGDDPQGPVIGDLAAVVKGLEQRFTDSQGDKQGAVSLFIYKHRLSLVGIVVGSACILAGLLIRHRRKKQ